MLQLPDPLEQSPPCPCRCRRAVIAQVVIQSGDGEAQGSNQSPEDPEVAGDEDLFALGVEIEKLGPENRLASFVSGGG